MEGYDEKIIGICLDSISIILDFGNEHFECTTPNNPYFKIIEESNGLKIFENLQNHPSTEIFNATQNFLNKYFETEWINVYFNISLVVIFLN